MPIPYFAIQKIVFITADKIRRFFRVKSRTHNRQGDLLKFVKNLYSELVNRKRLQL